VLDAGAGGLEDPQAVEREQADQRMLGRQAEPRGHQQGAELVTVQRDGVGLIIRPRPPDMSGRGVIQELFLDRVLAEPGDSAQPTASRSASVKAGWIVASAVDGAAVIVGHLPAGLEPGRPGQFRSQRLSGNPT
jgi:hypothetical protein